MADRSTAQPVYPQLRKCPCVPALTLVPTGDNAGLAIRVDGDWLLECDMDEQHRVYLIGGNDDETAIFTLFDERDHCRLRCEYRDKALEVSATDFFQALCDIRGLLANDGLIPFCYGASLNVYPSGMAKDMGQGLKAYKLAWVTRKN